MKIEKLLEKSWAEELKAEFSKKYFLGLKIFLEQEYNRETVYPPKEEILRAFHLTPFEKVKVVIIGQDPYHGFDQAHGLCFSVNDHTPHPPSLRNIFKEMVNDVQIPYPASGNLEKIAKQGVLLLNTTLTVRQSQPGSHQKKGWENFTDAVIKKISQKKKGIVFLLWGKPAESKSKFINEKHHILTTSHPSPFSAYRGFSGCNHFSKTNKILLKEGKKQIDWKVDEY